ncbi:hypothetical protein D3C76_1410110 [compost metagenome]
MPRRSLALSDSGPLTNRELAGMTMRTPALALSGLLRTCRAMLLNTLWKLA